MSKLDRRRKIARRIGLLGAVFNLVVAILVVWTWISGTYSATVVAYYVFASMFAFFLALLGFLIDPGKPASKE